MNKEVRVLRATDAAALEALVTAIAADLQENSTQEFLYIQDPADRTQALAEGRIVGYFLDKKLLGTVTFQEGDVFDILCRRFPDVKDVPLDLGDGVYTSQGMVLPEARGMGAMGDMLLHVASLHPEQAVIGTIHHQNEKQIRVRQRIGSYPMALLHSPSRPPMALYVRPASVIDIAAVA